MATRKSTRAPARESVLTAPQVGEITPTPKGDDKPAGRATWPGYLNFIAAVQSAASQQDIRPTGVGCVGVRWPSPWVAVFEFGGTFDVNAHAAIQRVVRAELRTQRADGAAVVLLDLRKANVAMTDADMRHAAVDAGQCEFESAVGLVMASKRLADQVIHQYARPAARFGKMRIVLYSLSVGIEWAEGYAAKQESDEVRRG